MPHSSSASLARPPSPLRHPALAVLVLAVAFAGVRVLQQVLQFLPRRPEALEYLIQASYLVSVPLDLLVTLAVIWLLMRSHDAQGVRLRPLIAFGLLVLSALTSPLQAISSAVLGALGSSGAAIGELSVVLSIALLGLELLLVLAVGAIALAILLRPEISERTVRVPGSRLVLALVTLGLALLFVVLLLAGQVVNTTWVHTSSFGVPLQVGVSMLSSLVAALLLPAAGLLITRSEGAGRRWAWIGVGLFALGTVAFVTSIRIMVFLLMAAPTGAGHAAWPLIGSVVQGIGTLGLAGCVVVALVQSRGEQEPSL